MDGMKRIMRYNEYQTDPLSLGTSRPFNSLPGSMKVLVLFLLPACLIGDACRSIAARCDLNPPWMVDPIVKYKCVLHLISLHNAFSNVIFSLCPRAFAASDAKLTDQDLIANMATLAVNGPTWDVRTLQFLPSSFVY